MEKKTKKKKKKNVAKVNLRFLSPGLFIFFYTLDHYGEDFSEEFFFREREGGGGGRKFREGGGVKKVEPIYRPRHYA